MKLKDEVELCCLQCSKTFKVIYKRKETAKYCSRRCMGLSKQKNTYNWAGDNLQKICLGCKKEFFVRPKESERAYCSRECVDEFVRKGERVKRTMSLCKNCSKELFVTSGVKQFCNKECQKHFGNKQKTQLFCQNSLCKKSFLVSDCFLHKKFCCVACKNHCAKTPTITFAVHNCENELCAKTFNTSTNSKSRKKYCSQSCFLQMLHASCKPGLTWYSYTKKNGEVIQVQGGYELALASFWDNNNIAFQTHKGCFDYVDDENVQHRYYPDFVRTIDSNEVYYDTKNSFLKGKTQLKISQVMKCNPTLTLIILDEIDLTNLGVQLPKSKIERVNLCAQNK